MHEETVVGHTQPVAPATRILFLDKVLLEPFAEEPRGVEVFNLNLIRDLASLGYATTVAIDPSWQEFIPQWLDGRKVELATPPLRAGKVFGALSMIPGLSSRPYDVLLLGNVANRLIPSLFLLRLLRVAKRCVLIAHRVPSKRSLQAQRIWHTDVLCVNHRIASYFNHNQYASVAVQYGVTEHERFHPPQESVTRPVVNFCVVGRLDNTWKGADTAIAAFRKLPVNLRERCKLHLASYDKPPTFPEPQIVAHSWMPFAGIPAFLREMDVMIAPSRDENEVILETFCQAMVQGMLTGLPILANNLPVLTEKLDKGGGLIFRDVDGLVAHMIQTIENPESRRQLGAQARQIALARYVWRTDRFANDYLQPRQRR